MLEEWPFSEGICLQWRLETVEELWWLDCWIVGKQLTGSEVYKTVQKKLYQ